MNIKDDFILSQINEGYLVGGSVRDALMGKSFVDRDIAIKGAEAFAKKLAEEFNVFKEYTNRDINLSFEFSRRNFSESYGSKKSAGKQKGKNCAGCCK